MKQNILILLLLIAFAFNCNYTPPEEIDEWEYVGLAENSIGIINSITFHPEDSNIIYVCTRYNYSDNIKSHLFRSIDNGATWDTIGNAFGGGGHFFEVVFDPSNDSIVYIVNGNALFKSNDGGGNWVNITGEIYVDWEINIHNLAINPQNTDILYIGMIGFHPGGIYKSTDGGANWNQIGQNLIYTTLCIEIDQQNPDIIYVSGNNSGDILKSIDGGNTWGFTGLYHTGVYINDILIDDENPNIIYAAVEYSLQEIGEYTFDYGVMKSTDAGETWTRFNEGLPDTAYFLPHNIIKDTNNGNLYLTLTSDSASIYKMPSESTTWEIVKKFERSNSRVGHIKLSPVGDMLYFCNHGIYRISLY